MRTSPSIVPHAADQDTYLVLDDFGGRLGCSWRDTDADSADRETLIRELQTANIAILSASSPSTPVKAGRETSLSRSPTNCADVTLSSARCRIS